MRNTSTLFTNMWKESSWIWL